MYPNQVRAMLGISGDSLNDAIYRATTTFLDWWSELLKQGGYGAVIGAVGDHDIGDNDRFQGSSKARAVETFKEAFGTSMIDPLSLPDLWNGVSPTAPEDGRGQYDETAHIYQHKNVLFIQVDVFRFEGPNVRLDGTNRAVLPQVAQSQLDWLRDVLLAAQADASVDHVIVQGHTPVLGPVNVRRSSGLTPENGDESPFFETIAPFGTNMGGKLRAYFAGEGHASTVTTDADSGIVQIAHGKAGRNDPKFITFEVTQTTIRGVQHEIVTARDGDQPLWTPGADKYGADGIHRVKQSTETVLIDVSTGEVSVAVTGTLDGWKGGGIDRFVGGTQDDDYTDRAGYASSMFGMGGNDTLRGLDGNDRVHGNDGNDVLNGGKGSDALFGGNGGFGDTASYADAAGNVWVSLSAGRSSGADGRDTLAAIENLEGSSHNDRLSGDSSANILSGLDGDDFLRGKGGDDVYLGGAGKDRMIGGDGDETMHGGPGNDNMRAAAGNDILFGDDGDDRLFGGRGVDTLFGGGGDDRLEGNRGRDQLDGGAGQDSLKGGANSDVLAGGAGDDWLRGGNGRDTLHGGTGNDVLIGGLTSDPGDGFADTFIFRAGDARDTIRQFEADYDRIDLTDFSFTDFTADLMPLMADRPSGLRIDFGAGDILFISGLTVAAITEDPEVFLL